MRIGVILFPFKLIDTLEEHLFRFGGPTHGKSQGEGLIAEFALPTALPRQWPQSGDGGHRTAEYGVLERATNALRSKGHTVDDSLLRYLSPLGWEHVNLSGDYLWRDSAKVCAGKFRPLRASPKP